MTNKEAAFCLANIDRLGFEDEMNDALDMAIKALEEQEQPTVEEATEEISGLLKTGYFKASKEEIKDLEETAVSKQYLEICKRVAERYPEKEVKKKGVADYLADDPSLTQQVGAEELGLADVRENRKSDLISREQACQLALNSVDKCITPNDIMRMSSVDAVSREVIKDIKADIPKMSRWQSDDGQDLVMVADVLELIDRHISGKEK